MVFDDIQLNVITFLYSLIKQLINLGYSFIKIYASFLELEREFLVGFEMG